MHSLYCSSTVCHRKLSTPIQMCLYNRCNVLFYLWNEDKTDKTCHGHLEIHEVEDINNIRSLIKTNKFSEIQKIKPE